MSLHGIPDFLDVLYPEFLNLAFSLTDISNFCFIFSTAEILSSIASTLLEMLAFAAPVFFKDFYLLYYIFLYFFNEFTPLFFNDLDQPYKTGI